MKINTIQKLIQTIINKGIPYEWVIIFTTQSKTQKDYGQAHNRMYGYKQRYTNMEWGVHHGDDNYSIICREKEPSV